MSIFWCEWWLTGFRGGALGGHTGFTFGSDRLGCVAPVSFPSVAVQSCEIF